MKQLASKKICREERLKKIGPKKHQNYKSEALTDRELCHKIALTLEGKNTLFNRNLTLLGRTISLVLKFRTIWDILL